MIKNSSYDLNLIKDFYHIFQKTHYFSTPFIIYDCVLKLIRLSLSSSIYKYDLF